MSCDHLNKALWKKAVFVQILVKSEYPFLLEPTWL